MGDLLAKRGLTMGVFVIDGGDNWKVSLTTGKPEFVDVFVKACRDAVEVARRTNAKWMTVVPGYYNGTADGHPDRARHRRHPSRRRRPRAARAGDGAGAAQRQPRSFLRTPDQGYALCRAVNSPACKILCDMYHVQRTRGA